MTYLVAAELPDEPAGLRFDDAVNAAPFIGARDLRRVGLDTGARVPRRVETATQVISNRRLRGARRL